MAAQQNHLHIIIDRETEIMLAERMKATGFNRSEAARDALRAGLGMPITDAVKRGMREGFTRAKALVLRHFGESFGASLEKALENLDL